MTMSSAKKKKSISDQINDILKPKELVEETDENETRLEEFTEHSGVDNQLSDIRKQTAKSLSELDKKYKGKVVTRAELEEADISNESSDESDTNGELEETLFATDSEDDDEEEDEIDEEDEDEGSENQSDDESGSEVDADAGDDYDLSQFAKPGSSSAPIDSVDVKTELLKKSSLNEEIKKGVSVQNQLKVWEKLLEVRIKSQKMLITANSLPDYDASLELSAIEDSEFSEKVEKACDGIHGLLDNLLELQSTLCNRFPETKDLMKTTKKRKEKNGRSDGGLLKRSKLAEYSDTIEENHNIYSSYRNQVLQKWNERTRTAKDSRNPAANLNILTKIENSLLGKSELIRKTQSYRGDYEIYGIERTEPNEDGTIADITIPEIFDDSEFYHQLLRELIEYKSNISDNQSEITQKFIELQKVRSKMKKKVDTRASKGRKIRYIVHNKLVNYMPPKDSSEFTEEAKSELYSSLFGMANQGERL